MKDQHEKITGYRDLTPEEIDLMNRVKKLAEEVNALIKDIQVVQPGAVHIDGRWLSIGITDLQKGFMAVTRSIARPTTF